MTVWPGLDCPPVRHSLIFVPCMYSMSNANAVHPSIPSHPSAYKWRVDPARSLCIISGHLTSHISQAANAYIHPYIPLQTISSCLAALAASCPSPRPVSASFNKHQPAAPIHPKRSLLSVRARWAFIEPLVGSLIFDDDRQPRP
jgi:hypothetical protein